MHIAFGIINSPPPHMNELIKYFFNHDERLHDSEICNLYKCKSGKLAETAFHALYPFMKSQVHYKNFIFDFCSRYSIYEVKNYMFDSTGTADEKLLYSLFKYVDILETTKYKHIIVVLAAKMKALYTNKYELMLNNYHLIDMLNDLGVYIVYMSNLINEIYFAENEMSFIKWVGGKSKLLNSIIPKIESQTFQIYLEPFIGSGAVLIHLLENSTDENMTYKVNDINSELITTYNVIKNNVNKLIPVLEHLASFVDETNYYMLRDLYNNRAEDVAYDTLDSWHCIDSEQDVEPSTEHLNLFTAALFIYLNKHVTVGYIESINKIILTYHSGIINIHSLANRKN